jgi:CheY-like chemotaxis protein
MGVRDLSLACRTGLPKKATAAEKEATMGTGTTIRRILIVDDEHAVAETLADILSGAGYEIEIAGSGQIALDLLATRGFDAILSDVRMPDLDGPMLYRHLKQSHFELCRRFVLVTGDALDSSIHEFLETTQLPYIEKPFSLHKVRQVVAAVIAEDPSVVRPSSKGSRLPS